MKNPEQNSNNAKGKAAVKQDLENTLSYYNSALTRKVVGQLFDDYVKEDEESFFTRNIDNTDYISNDKTDNENVQESNYYFGDTFNNFPKDKLLPNTDNQQEKISKTKQDEPEDFDDDYDDDDYDDFDDEDVPKKHKSFKFWSKKEKINNDDYYDYGEFSNDFDEFDETNDNYEIERQEKKENKKICKQERKEKKKKYNDDYEEYEDVLDRKRRELNEKKAVNYSEPKRQYDNTAVDMKRNSKSMRVAENANSEPPKQKKKPVFITQQPKQTKQQKQPNDIKQNKMAKPAPAKSKTLEPAQKSVKPQNNIEYNVLIRDLSVPPEEDEFSFTQSLPPLEKYDIPQREPSYEDVMKYSPRRRGGRNQTVKKKKRVPLSENKNLYSDGISQHTPKRKNQAQKSKIIIHNPAPKKRRRSYLPLILLFIVFTLIASLSFCITKISSLQSEIDRLNAIQNNNQTIEQPTDVQYAVEPKNQEDYTNPI